MTSEARGALRSWGLEDAELIPLLGGEQKHVWRVGGDLVLRLYPTFVPRASVEQECRWLAVLAQQLPEVPAPVHTSRGDAVVVADGRCAVLAPYVEGVPVRSDAPAQRTAMAATLARIHRASAALHDDGASVHPPLRDLDWSSNHWWDTSKFRELAVGRELWEATRPRLEHVDVWLRALDGLPSQVVHNDYGVVNVLVRDDRVAGVIDWDWATVDWRLVDVAHAIGSIARRGPTFDLGRVHEFIDRYRTAGGVLEADEIGLLPAVLRLRITWTALYDLGRACAGRLDADAARYRLWTLHSVDQLAADLVGRVR